MLPDLWYRNAVVYSLDLETFQDSDGDGCGDFEGLSRRLDYLESLGVNTVWLGPFQPTPNRDNGYDISDYYGVDPRHGSLGDFVEFLHEAGSRGIRVIMDLVVNHTSDRHPWFRDARSSKSAPLHDWYVWSKKRPPNWKSGMVFPGVQERTWTRAPEAGEYYFHRFYEFQPDLNMENPEVREEIRRIMGFWLALGVAGFRLDAVPFILEKPSAGGGAQPLRFEYLEEMRRFLQWRVGDAVLLGEANVLPEEARRYFSERGGLHLMFNFWVNQHAFYALASGDARPLVQAVRATRKLPQTAQWAQFLRNHDELDLGRLTKEQRAAVFERFGPEKRMQLYDRGIRRRLAPMQWSAEPHAGFTAGDKPVTPLVSGGPYGYESVNVDSQQRDPGSLLRWMTRMIRLRTQCPEIGWGECEPVPTRSPHVLALLYRWRGSAVLCVHNFDEHPREVTVRLKGEGAERLVDLIDEDSSESGDGVHRLSLDGLGYRWFALGRGDAAPRRRTG